jgi:hypothetical protein
LGWNGHAKLRPVATARPGQASLKSDGKMKDVERT